MQAKVVHSAGFVFLELALTSLIWCNAKLATNILIFLCLYIIYIIYIIKVIDINEIIEERNTKRSLLEKKFLLELNMESCLSCKSKISFLLVYQFTKSFKSVDACNSDLSNRETFNVMGKICSNVVLFLISAVCRESVKLGNISR